MFNVLKLNLQGMSAYQIARQLEMDPPSVYSSLKSAKRNFAAADKMLNELKALGWPLKLPEIEEKIRNRSPQRNSSETEEIAIKTG